MQRLPVYLAVLCAMMATCGCKRGPLPKQTPAEQEAAVVDAQQQKVLEEILKYQRESGSTLGSLVKEIERRKAVEAQAIGPSPLQRDLAVARSLLVGTRRAVHAEDWEAALGTLRRLAATVDVMQGETPAARIRTFLERAALALQGSAAGIEADVASACLLSALDVALKSGDAPLVPEIAENLEKTKTLIDKGEYKTGLKAVEELVPTVADHRSVVMLDNAAAGVAGAHQAMRREAGLVVLAELDQLSDLFNRFATMLKAAPSGIVEEKAAEEEEGEAEEEEAEERGAATEEAPSPPAAEASREESEEAESTGASATEAEEETPVSSPRRRSRR